jgi:hypothetical protein
MTLSLRKITALGVVDAAELREKAVTGDLEAARGYILYSAWRRISSVKNFTKRSKIKALALFAGKVEVKWPTASS